MTTTKKVVVEDDEEDATIEEEAEDGIGSRDRSTSSDTKLMRNKEGSSRKKEEESPGRRKLRVRCRRGGRRDHPREGWGALAALFKESQHKREVEEDHLGNPEWSQKRDHSKF